VFLQGIYSIYSLYFSLFPKKNNKNAVDEAPSPAIYRVYRPGSQAINLTNSSTWWLDETLPPFKKA